MTKTSHEFYIEFNGILLIGNGRIQHANYCCIISLIGKYLHGEGWDHCHCILFIFCSTFTMYRVDSRYASNIHPIFVL